MAGQGSRAAGRDKGRRAAGRQIAAILPPVLRDRRSGERALDPPWCVLLPPPKRSRFGFAQAGRDAPLGAPQHEDFSSCYQIFTSSCGGRPGVSRSEEHTSELQSLMRISYAVFCLQKKIITP